MMERSFACKLNSNKVKYSAMLNIVRAHIFVISRNYAQITPREPTFLAPEMRFTDVDLRRGTYRKRIGRSTDVWKIPDIALEVLTPKGSPYPIDGMLKTFLEKTEHVHSACKNINEYKRPLSKDVLIEYLKLYNKIIK